MKKKTKRYSRKDFLNKNKEIEKKDILYNTNSLKYSDSKIKKIKIYKIKEINNEKLLNNIIQCKEYFRNLIIKIYRIERFIIWLYIFLNSINLIDSENNDNNRNLKIQNIIYLKIEGKESQKIIHSEILPDLVILNDDKEIQIQKNGSIYIKKDLENINEIKMIWNKKLDNLENFFNSLNSIIEIDLSEFDTSEVTTMNNMFDNCEKLEYINFDNINTSLVTSMSYMFHKCYSLVTIDLSYFDTSKVQNMNFMFFECSSLFNLDITNLNTSELRTMEYMFYG